MAPSIVYVGGRLSLLHSGGDHFGTLLFTNKTVALDVFGLLPSSVESHVRQSLLAVPVFLGSGILPTRRDLRFSALSTAKAIPGRNTMSCYHKDNSD